MNYLAVRFVFWLVALAAFPIPASLLSQSFQVEVLQRITLAALPLSPESESPLEWTDRVLVRLEEVEKKEIDPWYRDDIRIAWTTTHWSQHGVPSWSLHGYATPHVAATWQVLHCAPDQVWPRILAAREVKLGALHSQVWGEGASSPRKPVRSVGLAEYERRRKKTA